MKRKKYLNRWNYEGIVNFKLQCLGPEASAVKYGKLISVYVVDDNSILAFSAASLTL